MASIRQSIRSSTASKRPTSAIADGQIALNTASGTPGMFFKDNAGNIIKTGPAHYGASAPNSSPAVGGSTGNSIGEAWLDSSLTPAGWKIWNGSAWVNATPLSSDTVQGLVELATNAETQAGADTARAVTSAGLQSKVSDSVSTTSASGIASSTAVKTAYDLANAALPKSGGIVTGNLEIGSTGSLTFEGTTADGFETTLAVVDPTLDRTITFPNITGTVVTTGDTGTVTSTMILDGTILNADVNASAAIAGTKISPDFGSQNTTTTGTSTAASFIPTSSSVPTNGVYLPAANSVAISTSGAGRITVDASGNVNIDSNTLYVDAVNNRVGVGTTSPSYLLDVVGTINSTAISGFNTQSDNTTLVPLAVKDVGAGTDEKTWRVAQTQRAAKSLQIGNVLNDASSAANTSITIVRSGATIDNIQFATGSSSERARIDSNGRLLVGASSDSGGALFQVNGDRIRIGTAKTPASASATGAAGEICWDASYIYVCTATNTWKRTAIATW